MVEYTWTDNYGFEHMASSGGATPDVTASGVLWQDYGDYLNALFGSGYEQPEDFGSEQELILAQYIYAPADEETGNYLVWETRDSLTLEDMEKLPELELFSLVGDDNAIEEMAMAMAGIAADSYWLPGEKERILAGDYSPVYDSMPEGLPLLGLAGLIWSILSGASIWSILAGLVGVVGGWIIPKAFAEGVRAMYIGGRLAGLVKGDVTLKTATGFGMKRMVMKPAGTQGAMEGKRVEIRR